MRVSAQIFYYIFWPCKRPFGEHYPLLFKDFGIDLLRYLKFAFSDQVYIFCPKNRAHDLYVEQVFALVLRALPLARFAQPATRHNAMQVRMQTQILAPGMQNGDHAHFSAQVFWVVPKLL